MMSNIIAMTYSAKTAPKSLKQKTSSSFRNHRPFVLNSQRG